MVHATWSVIASEKDKTNHLHEFGRSPFCFFFARAFRPVWPGRCDLSFICIPQSTRALDQGGVEPRQAASPKALRPWTIPLRYSVGLGEARFAGKTVRPRYLLRSRITKRNKNTTKTGQGPPRNLDSPRPEAQRHGSDRHNTNTG